MKRRSAAMFRLTSAQRILLLLCAGAVWAAAQTAPDELLQHIQALIQQGDTAGAKAQVTAAIGKHPQEPVLYNFLGVLEAQEGKYREAESSFRKAIRLGPRYAGAYMNLGRLYQENAAKDEQAARKAIAVYQGLLSLDPASVEGNYQIAVLLAADGAYQGALEHVTVLPAQTQARAQTLSVRCAAEAGLGDEAAAARTAVQLLSSSDLGEADVTSVLPVLAKRGQDQLAVRLLEGLEERRLASTESLRHLAAFYEKQNELVKARQALERSAAPGTVTAPFLLDLARVAYKQKDWEGSLGYLAHARDLEPKNASIHFFFAMVCVELNLPVEAEKSLREAVKLDPGNPYYNYALGAVLANGRNWGEAIAHYEKYCDSKPDDPRGKLALASAHFHNYDLEKARKELLEVVGKPETAPGAHYHLGLMALQENEFDQAAKEFQEAVRRDAKFGEAWAELGYAQLHLEQFEEARKSLDRSLAIDPEGRRANMVLLALYQRTDDPRAEAQAKRFEELDKKQSERLKLLLRTIEVRPY